MSHKETWLFTVVKSINIIFSANVRSAVRVFTGEAGVIRQPPDALLAVFALKHQAIFPQTVKNRLPKGTL